MLPSRPTAPTDNLAPPIFAIQYPPSPSSLVRPLAGSWNAPSAWATTLNPPPWPSRFRVCQMPLLTSSPFDSLGWAVRMTTSLLDSYAGLLGVFSPR